MYLSVGKCLLCLCLWCPFSGPSSYVWLISEETSHVLTCSSQQRGRLVAIARAQALDLTFSHGSRRLYLPASWLPAGQNLAARKCAPDTRREGKCRLLESRFCLRFFLLGNAPTSKDCCSLRARLCLPSFVLLHFTLSASVDDD